MNSLVIRKVEDSRDQYMLIDTDFDMPIASGTHKEMRVLMFAIDEPVQFDAANLVLAA